MEKGYAGPLKSFCELKIMFELNFVSHLGNCDSAPLWVHIGNGNFHHGKLYRKKKLVTIIK